MCSAKTVLVVVAVVALAAYGFDCLAMTMPEQAMQCCNSMPCVPNGHHSQDCCKTMPSVQTAFLQSSVGHTVSSAEFGAMTITEFGERPDASTEKVNARVSHPPPIAYFQASPPIRI
jgi:hypothetical protein